MTALHICAFYATCLCLACMPAHTRAQDVHDPAHRSDAVDEVVVTASPLDKKSDELAVPVTVLERAQVLDHLRETLGETLAREPGIHTTGFATGASRPVIRGQDAFRVRILEDAVGVHDVSSVSPDHGVPVNPLAARRVEVVRGPAALRHGGGAIGGVVNVITNRVPRALPERALEGELYTAYGTGARARDGALLLEGAAGPIAWHLDGVSRDSDDYHVANQIEDELDFSDTDGYALAGGASYFFAWGRVGGGFSRFANVYGIPGPEDPAEPVSIDLYKNHYAFEADVSPPLPGVRELRLRGGVSHYQHDEVAGGTEIASRFDNDEKEGRLELLHEPLGPFTGAIGVHWSQRDLSASGEGGEYLAPADSDSLAAYLFEEVSLGDTLRLELGGRLEDAEVSGTPAVGAARTRDFDLASGSLGLFFEPGETVSVGLTAQLSERAPDPVELFARGPHEATETFEVGDPDLDAETAKSVDLTARLTEERYQASASLFYTRYDDYIAGFLTGVACDEMGCPVVGGELRELLYQQRDAAFRGLELEGSVDLIELAGGHLGVDAQLDLVRADFTDSRGGDVPRIPPVRYGAGVHFANERVRGRVGFLRTASQNRTGEGETRTGGHTFFDAELGVTLFERGDGSELRAFVRGTNLFDEDGRNHISFKKDDVVLPGQSFRFGLHARF